MSIAIRTLGPEDLEAADTVLRAAYGRADPWQSELRRYLALEPTGWFAATIDGELAGTGGAIDYGPFAWIGLMGVDPGRQRRGIGKAILDRVLKWLEVKGCPVAVLDASAAGEPLYAGSGFVDEGTTALFQRDIENGRTSRPDRVATMRMDNLSELAELDAPIFGADRRRVLASFFADDPDRAFLVRDVEGTVTGYLCAQTQRLGPWVASTSEDAEALLLAALSLDFDGAPIVLAPSQNCDVQRLIGRYGFREQRRLRHMYRGLETPPQQRNLIYGEASFGIG